MADDWRRGARRMSVAVIAINVVAIVANVWAGSWWLVLASLCAIVVVIRSWRRYLNTSTQRYQGG